VLNFEITDSKDTPIYSQIANAVCEAVASGEIASGEKLPAESVLAKQLGINRLTVSRAYEHLRGSSIVIQKRGSGTYVAPGALPRARHRFRRRIKSLMIVLGEESLSECRRETLFIKVDILDGLRDILGEGATRFTYVKSFTRAHIAELSEDDAVIVHTTKERDATLFAEALDRAIPIASVWEDWSSPIIPHVDYDRHQSTALACRHLVECRHKRIGYLGRKSHWHLPVSPKFVAFTSVLNESGLDIHARYVRDVGVQPGKAYAAARDLIQAGDLPEAFFVDTDYKAMEVVCAFNDAGLKVPQDVGIVSYDDVPDAASFDPPLTTVRVPRRELGRRAAKLLLDWPRDGTVPESVLLTSELIVRGSSQRSR